MGKAQSQSGKEKIGIENPPEVDLTNPRFQPKALSLTRFTTEIKDRDFASPNDYGQCVLSHLWNTEERN